jgi:hypothetical protein
MASRHHLKTSNLLSKAILFCGRRYSRLPVYCQSGDNQASETNQRHCTVRDSLTTVLTTSIILEQRKRRVDLCLFIHYPDIIAGFAVRLNGISNNIESEEVYTWIHRSGVHPKLAPYSTLKGYKVVIGGKRMMIISLEDAYDHPMITFQTPM